MRITNELASRVSSNGLTPRVMTASDVLSFRVGPAVAGAIAAATPAGGDIGTIRPGAGRAKAARAPSLAPHLWIKAIALSLGFHAFAVVAVLVWPTPAPEPAAPDVIPVEIIVEKSLPDDPPAPPAPLTPPAEPTLPAPPPFAAPPSSAEEAALVPPRAVETPSVPVEVPPLAAAPPPTVQEQTFPNAPAPSADQTPVPEALSPTAAAVPRSAVETPPVLVEVPPPAVARQETNPIAPPAASPTPASEALPPTPNAAETPPVLVEVPPLAIAPPPTAARETIPIATAPAFQTPARETPPPAPTAPSPAAKAPLPEKIAPPTMAPRERTRAPALVRPAKAVPASPRNPPSRAPAESQTGSLDAAKPALAARQSSGAVAAEAAEYQQAVIARLSAVKHYPEAARDRAPHGVAIVSFSIGASGSVGAVSIAQSAGDPALDAEAVATVRRASPFPAPPNGAPRTYSAPLSFRIR